MDTKETNRDITLIKEEPKDTQVFTKLITDKKGINTNFILTNDHFSLKITKNYESWERKFELKEILILSMWKNLKTTKNLLNFITQVINKYDYDINLETDPATVTFKSYSKDMEDVFFEYILEIPQIRKGIPGNLSDLVHYIKELESRFQNQITILENKLNNDCLLKENLALKEKIVDLKLGSKIDCEFISSSHFELTNNQKTARKTTKNQFHGIRGNRIVSLNNKGKYHYSVRIDDTDPNTYFMLGFAATSVNQTTGFYAATNFLGFSLGTDMTIYGSNLKIQNYIKPMLNMVFDVVVDFDEKSIYLYCDGAKLGFANVIFNYLDYTPCLDLHTLDSSVTLV